MPEPEATGPEEDWKQATLDAHNTRRMVHSAPPLTWSDECYREAKKQADACQAKSTLFHGCLEGPSGQHGQNAYGCSMPGSSADSVVQSWYSEIDNPGYDFSKPGYTPGTGHFTQVVWKATTHVGMAISEDGLFVVANYLPAGNFMPNPNFETNVMPPNTGKAGSSAKAGEKPAAAGGAAASAGASAGGGDSDGSRTVSAESMTKELQAMLDGCPPSEFKDEVLTACKQPGAKVTVTLCENAGEHEMKVVIQQGCCSSELRGTWT